MNAILNQNHNRYEEHRQPYVMMIGASSYTVASLAEASRRFEIARDIAMHRGGDGASQTPEVTVLAGDKIVARISYNGRVWGYTGKAPSPNDVLLHDPRNDPERPIVRWDSARNRPVIRTLAEINDE